MGEEGWAQRGRKRREHRREIASAGALHAVAQRMQRQTGRGGVGGGDEVVRRCRGGGAGRGVGRGKRVRKKFDGVGSALGACFWHIYSMATVVLRRSAKVPSIDAMWCPGTADSRVFVDKNPGAVCGARGVRLYSKAPLSCASADSFGLMREGRRRFKVVVAWWMRRHHRCRGKAGSVLLRPATKLSFQMLMALLAAFVRCTCGGTS